MNKTISVQMNKTLSSISISFCPFCSLEEAGVRGWPRRSIDHPDTSEAGFAVEWSGRQRGRMQSCSPLSAAQWHGKNPAGQGFRVEICEANTTRPLTGWIGAAAVERQMLSCPSNHQPSFQIMEEGGAGNFGRG